jgi:hypothetical protein
MAAHHPMPTNPSFVFNVIIVSGAPGVGKSALVNWLSQATGFTTIRPNLDHNGLVLQYYLQMATLTATTRPVLLIVEGDSCLNYQEECLVKLMSHNVESSHVTPPKPVSEVGYGPNTLLVWVCNSLRIVDASTEAGIPVFTIDQRGAFTQRNVDLVNRLMTFDTLSDDWKVGLAAAIAPCDEK